MATVYLRGFPVSMLVSTKLSGYLLSLLLASVLFFAGGESLSERQVLLLLRADMQKRTCVSTRFTRCCAAPAPPSQWARAIQRVWKAPLDVGSPECRLDGSGISQRHLQRPL